MSRPGSARKFLVPLLVAGLMAAVVAGCTESPPPITSGTAGTVGTTLGNAVDGYVALVPSVLRSGETASFSFTLTDGDRPARGSVSVTLLDDQKTIASGSAEIMGTGTVSFELPAVTPGAYTVRVAGQDFSETATVQVQAGTLLFLETDKPVYKPGQTIMMRLVALDSELKPVRTEATIEIQDAMGIKFFMMAVSSE